VVTDNTATHPVKPESALLPSATPPVSFESPPTALPIFLQPSPPWFDRHFRRKLVVALKKDLREECEFVRQMALENPKNYQIWHHRRVIVEMLGDGSLEGAFTQAAFNAVRPAIHCRDSRDRSAAPRPTAQRQRGEVREGLKIICLQDSKNYHAWSHRQWAVKHFELWDGELAFVDQASPALLLVLSLVLPCSPFLRVADLAPHPWQLLDTDIRNNSAWNQRHFVVANTTEGGAQAAAEQEIAYAKGRILQTPCNDSAWNYLRSYAMPRKEAWAETAAFCEAVMEQEPRCWQAMDLLVHVCLKMGAKGDLEKAARLCDDLAGRADTVRRKYWEHIKAGAA